jgi:hypothetical protein
VILVDSSVWINYFNGNPGAGAIKLEALLNRQRSTLRALGSGVVTLPSVQTRIAVGDLILTEVLQGFRDEAEFVAARKFLTRFRTVELGGKEIAIQAAKNHRILRGIGITIRKTMDTLIATRCIEDGHELLYDDRDFDPFVKHLGLRVVS